MSMFFDDCFHTFIHHLKVPFIYASPGGLFGSFHDMTGNIDFPGITGSKLLEPGFPLTFEQRLETTLMNELFTDKRLYLVPNNVPCGIEGAFALLTHLLL
ncbi:hypothetical protein Avbf_03882 [Armadillidium vulgare]|nr:hypothetical protein Avbf_03882 [Armadillidium vulgare]